MHSERNRQSCASCHRTACRIAQWRESLTCKCHRFRNQEINVEVIQLVPNVRMSDHIVEQIVKLSRVLERVVEQIIDAQKPQVMEKIVKVQKKHAASRGHAVPTLCSWRRFQVRIQKRFIEQVVNVQVQPKFSRKRCRERIQSSE